MEAILEHMEAMHEEVWNVATSQRRDVGSTNVQVNKRQRRDVSTSSAFSALKASGGADLESSGGVRTRARNSRAGVTPTSKKCL